MKQIFILGRNPELSRQEIFAFLRARKIKNTEIFFNENLLLLEIEKIISIQELGGTIKSGKIEFDSSEKEFQDYVQRNELVPSDKFTFAVFGNGDIEILKEKFKIERKKAVMKHGGKKIRLQEGDELFLGNVDFSLFFHELNNNIYFGLINQEYDYSEVKKRDMEKPVRRESLAISPRLSKILINLSEAKAGDFLIDPFCGIGGILMEALIKNIDVYGVDKDRTAIADAKQNLQWLINNYRIKSRFSLMNADSSRTPDMKFDAIATETPLGELLKKKSTRNEGGKIISDFERMIIPILNRLRYVKKPTAKIAITFPVISKNHVDIEGLSEATGLRVVLKPILESRPDQFVSREILVLE